MQARSYDKHVFLSIQMMGLLMLDCHCHLTFITPGALDKEMTKLSQEGVKLCFLAGVNPREWQEQLTFSNELLGIAIKKSIGLHPWFIDANHDKQLDNHLRQMIDTCRHEKDIVAIGEIGLDYARAKNDNMRRRQLFYFEEQIKIAIQNNYPIVVHNVKAHHDVSRVLKRYGNRLTGILLHSFTGKLSVLRPYLDLDCYFSLSPKSIKSMKESTVQAIPIQKLLIESDEPSRCNAALQFRQDASFDNSKKELSPFSLESFAREQVNALSTVARYICGSHNIAEDKLWSIVESNLKDFLQKN